MSLSKLEALLNTFQAMLKEYLPLAFSISKETQVCVSWIFTSPVSVCVSRNIPFVRKLRITSNKFSKCMESIWVLKLSVLKRTNGYLFTPGISLELNNIRIYQISDLQKVITGRKSSQYSGTILQNGNNVWTLNSIDLKIMKIVLKEMTFHFWRPNTD